MIEETGERENISACVQVLAGLRFEKILIRQLFRLEELAEALLDFNSPNDVINYLANIS